MPLLVLRNIDEIDTKGRSVIRIKRGDRIVEKPIRDITAVLVVGRGIKIESSTLAILATHNIPVAILAKGSIALLYNPVLVKNNHYRMLQYQLPEDKRLEIALEYIKAKIMGMNNILAYHRKPRLELPEPPMQSGSTKEFENQLRLWESITSIKLWRELVKLLPRKTLAELKNKYGFTGRKPRNPDPFNKTLSVMYAVLYSLATRALISAGLDPTYGFLHKTRYSTPLTFDYTEMFKPIAIHATIQLITQNGLPKLDKHGELPREAILQTIKTLYDHLTLYHKDTKKTLHKQIYLKAFCLARYLEGRCPKRKLTITYDRRVLRTPKTKRKPTLENKQN